MKLRVRIGGSKVHGVGYRVILLRKAMELGADKFNALNSEEDGLQVVTAFIEGSEDTVEEFSQAVRSHQPAGAEVSEISFYEYGGHIIAIDAYMHLVQVEQLDKGISALFRIDQKQDKMLEKQDKMLEKQDKMLEKQDRMLEKQDETREDIVNEIRSLRGDLKISLDDRFARIEADIDQIKAKIGL
jgi:acylphosphatase